MGKYADLLLVGDDPATDAAVQRMEQKVQAARERQRRERGAMPAAPVQAPPQVEQQAPQAPRRYSDDLLGSEQVRAAPAPMPNPEEESISEWLVNSIRGRQDPREAQTGTVFEQFRDDLTKPTADAAVLGASDAGMGDVISKTLGDRFIRREKDANGYEVIVSRGPNGEEQRGYVNRPGLDRQDVFRGLYGSIPYLATGGAAGALAKGAGIGVNALAQGVAAGGTSIAGDALAPLVGSDQGIDLGKAGAMAGIGAAAVPVGAAAGALWRKFITVPSYFNKATGQLTPKGIEAAKRAGLDPNDLTPDFAKSFSEAISQNGNPARAAVRAGTERYGIPATEGQVTKDPYLLTREEGMRRRLFGESAQDTMRAFDVKQEEAIRNAALGRGPLAPKPGTQSVGEAIAPNRAGGINADRMPSVLGGSLQDSLGAVKSAMKGEEGALWKAARDLEVTPEALATLPDMLNKSLNGRMLGPQTPAAVDMAKQVQRILTGEAPEKAAEWIAASPTRNVDQMRRSLLETMKTAKDEADGSAAGLIYDGFNDWISEAAKASLLKGEPEAAMALVKARGFSREINKLFKPTDAAGRLSPAGQRLAKIMDTSRSDSGEAVVDALFGSQGSRGVNSGSVSALNSIKVLLARHPDKAVGAQAWNDVGLAYWSRLVTGRNGEMLGAQAIVNNVKGAMQNQRSLIKTLYSPKVISEIQSFTRALEAVAYKPPNASGSGYAAASFIKDGLMKLLESFGVGRPAMAALNYTGIGNAWNAATARRAVSQAARPKRFNPAPITAAGGALYDRSR